MEAYGFSGRLLHWIADFLIGRQQCMHINGCFSEWSPVRSGVPQGSMLGPLWFVIYVNDLPQCVSQSLVYLFADDLKIFHRISTPSDRGKLQDDIHRVCEWAKESRLQLHPEKCVTMSVGTRGRNSTYTLSEGQELQVVDSEKDFGVVIDNQLKFTQSASHAEDLQGKQDPRPHLENLRIQGRKDGTAALQVTRSANPRVCQPNMGTTPAKDI